LKEIQERISLIDLILLYSDLKTIVQSNEVTILLPNTSRIYIDDYLGLISDIYGYKTINSIKIPNYRLWSYSDSMKKQSKIIIRILDDFIISLCSVKYFDYKTILFEHNLNFDIAVKNPRFPNYYVFDVSKNIINDYKTNHYTVVFYDEYENIINCKYEIRFY